MMNPVAEWLQFFENCDFRQHPEEKSAIRPVCNGACRALNIVVGAHSNEIKVVDELVEMHLFAI